MAKRRNLKLGKSKRIFRKTAGVDRMHPKNRLSNVVMRGGIRL